METTRTLILGVAVLCSTGVLGQDNRTAFHTVTQHKTQYIVSSGQDGSNVDFPYDTTCVMVVDSAHVADLDFSCLSAQQLEELIVRYEKYLHDKRKRNTSKGKHSQKIISYYNGTSHELNLSNLKAVIEEVGLSNQLFVLAQAVLETGNFTSAVCRNYNNLFGLYDSKHKDFYRFARWEDSVVGYQRFIQYRYNDGNYLHFLKRIGYAEDPRYTSKVAQIATQLYKRLFTK